MSARSGGMTKNKYKTIEKMRKKKNHKHIQSTERERERANERIKTTSSAPIINCLVTTER